MTFADRCACGVRTLVTVMLLAGVPHTGCMASRSVQNRLEHADFVERAFIRKEVTEPGVVQVVYEAHHHSGQTSDGPLWTFGVQAGCESTDARVWSDDSWVEVELGAPPLELRRRNESLDYEAARELARGAGGVSRARHGCFVFMVPYDDEEPEAAHRWPFATHPDYFSTAILHVEPQEPPPRLAAAAAGALFLDLATFPIQVLLAPAWFALQ